MVYSYWPKSQLFNFWASYKVVYSESFNFYFLGFWASKYSSKEDGNVELKDSGLGLWVLCSSAFFPSLNPKP